MQTPIRFHRAVLEQLEGPPEWNESEAEDRDRIMQSCTHLFLASPPCNTTLSAIADSLRVKRSRLRWLFSDLDGLLGAILQAHLLDLLGTMKEAELATDGGRAARDAYSAATRTMDGGHTPDHALYLRYRHALPPDQLALLAPIMDAITDCASPEHGALALSILDAPRLAADEAELAFQSILSARGRAPEAAPHETPAPDISPPGESTPAQSAPPSLLNKPPPPSNLAALSTSSLRKLHAECVAEGLPDEPVIWPPDRRLPQYPVFAR